MATIASAQATAGVAVSGLQARLLLAVAIVAGLAAGLLATNPVAAAAAGADLTRLLRAMAVLKAMAAAAVSAGVFWRLGAAIAGGWLGAYLLSCAAMAAGVGLIWGMAHVALGALLLHGGLLSAVLLLWRDPVVSERLVAIVASRRAALRKT